MSISTCMLSPPTSRQGDHAFLPSADDFEIDVTFGDSLPDLDPTFWLLRDDFDFSVFDRMGPGYSLYASSAHALKPPDVVSTSPCPSVMDLRPIWYTQFRPIDVGVGVGTNTGVVPPAQADAPLGDEIDEICRANMAIGLQPPLRNEPLPSIDFMNLCIHLFFTRFNVMLPMIHSPTFRPTLDNALLVLSICSGGTLSLGSEMAAKTGSMLFERVNKAVLASSWERLLTGARPDHIHIMTKTSMIGQTFALISGNPLHLTTASAYHGSLIAVARNTKLFRETPPFHLPDNLSTEDLDAAWRKWAKEEEAKRIALVLHIHDAEIAALFHHEPILRHNLARLPSICTAELFSAPTAAAWASRYRSEEQERKGRASTLVPNPPTHVEMCPTATPSPHSALDAPFHARLVDHQNPYHLYTALSGIGASINESRHLGVLSPTRTDKLESDLLSWYDMLPDHTTNSGDHLPASEAPFTLLPLWHHTFMTLHTDLSELEVAVGREGSDIPPATREYVCSWLSSAESKRCLLHALHLQAMMAASKTDSISGIHTSRILFSAAVCWYAYMLYLPLASNGATRWNAPVSDEVFESFQSFPEIQRLRDTASTASTSPSGGTETIANLQKILSANPAEMKARTLCVLEGLLRRLGGCGISRKFADIVHVFISGECERDAVEDSSRLV